jgi:hypothetical protein
MSAFPTRIAGRPWAGRWAGSEDWRIGCSGCTGNARHMRERPHLLSGALELGRCSRLEIPNTRAGRRSDRIRRMSDSGKSPVSAPPLAPALIPVLSEALEPSALFLLLFRRALVQQRFCRFLLRLPPPVQTLAHGSLPHDGEHLTAAPRYSKPGVAVTSLLGHAGDSCPFDRPWTRWGQTGRPRHRLR